MMARRLGELDRYYAGPHIMELTVGIEVARGVLDLGTW
jgi:hypothetical protein